MRLLRRFHPQGLCQRGFSNVREPPAQLGRHEAVAAQTKRPHVGEIALAAALGDRDDVIGVPEVTPVAPFLFKTPARCEVELSLVTPHRLGVEAAQGADPTIALEDLLTQIARVSAELPLMDAVVAAKSQAPSGGLTAAPAAGLALPRHTSTGRRAAGAHTRSS
jgi:hypothetical protein